VARRRFLSRRARSSATHAPSYRIFATDCGLVSYGTDKRSRGTAAAGCGDRILKGEKPGGLPVQQPPKFM